MRPALPSFVTIHPDIADALLAGGPVVALESTIITHGMPHPENLETAWAVEAMVREAGAIPATIAVLDGALRIGLSQEELERLSVAEGVAKLSRADLAFCIAQGGTGSTTVAATMMAAQMAGIDIFATGGIGGVHRGAELDFDISADLEELGRTDVIVVCAGPKAILDLPKTLQVLETKGVPVIGYGTDELPAFWSRTSGLAAPLRLDTPDEIARFAATRRQMGGHGGVLIANPVSEEHAISGTIVDGWIDMALDAAREQNIAGKDATPFLLQYIAEVSAGESLATNIALITSNARLAAKIAVAAAR